MAVFDLHRRPDDLAGSVQPGKVRRRYSASGRVHRPTLRRIPPRLRLGCADYAHSPWTLDHPRRKLADLAREDCADPRRGVAVAILSAEGSETRSATPVPTSRNPSHPASGSGCPVTTSGTVHDSRTVSRLDPARLAEAELLQDPSRREIPVPDPCPQSPVASLARPGDHSPTCLGCVPAAVSCPQQLIGQLRFFGRAVPMEGQPAIPNDVGRGLPLYRQKTQPRLRKLYADLRSDVLHSRSPVGVYLPMRRHPQIPLSPQLAIDGGLGHLAMPKDEALGLPRCPGGVRATCWQCVSGSPPVASLTSRRTTLMATVGDRDELRCESVQPFSSNGLLTVLPLGAAGRLDVSDLDVESAQCGGEPSGPHHRDRAGTRIG